VCLSSVFGRSEMLQRIPCSSITRRVLLWRGVGVATAAGATGSFFGDMRRVGEVRGDIALRRKHYHGAVKAHSKEF